jgi:hypothetical protein
MTLAAEHRRKRGWLPGLLVLSLAVNAYFLGAQVTEYFRFRHGDGPPRAARMELRWLKDRLSGDSVRSIEASLDSLRPDIAARIERLKKLRTELGVLVAAPAPDRAAIDAHLRDIRMEVGAMQEQVQSRTFDAVLALPPAQRAPLATPRKDD